MIGINFGRVWILRARFEQSKLFKSRSKLHKKNRAQKFLLNSFLNNLWKANRKSPQPPSMREQVPNIPRLGIEIPLGLLEHLPEQEMTPSPVAPNEHDDNFLGFVYRVDVKSSKDWATVTQFMRATVTHFMRGSIGFEVQEPDVTEDFKQFLVTIYGSKWEKNLAYQTMIVEQL